MLTQTFAVLMGATLVEVSRVGGWLSRALLFVLGPIAAAVTHVLLSPKRELRADELAVRVTNRPDDLADALVRLDAAAELVSFSASPATEPSTSSTLSPARIASRACSRRTRRSGRE